MTKHQLSERFRPIAGGALIGFGVRILSGNLDRTVAHVSHIFGTTAGGGLGVLPFAFLEVSQAVQVYASDHQALLWSLLRLLASFWPLLLVIVGAILFQDAFTDKVKAPPTPVNISRNSDTGCRFCCASFDV
jgi:hypothetical protein